MICYGLKRSRTSLERFLGSPNDIVNLAMKISTISALGGSKVKLTNCRDGLLDSNGGYYTHY